MMGMLRKGFLCWAAAAAALLSMTWTPAARAHDDADDRALRAAVEHAERLAPPGKRPIVETHIPAAISPARPRASRSARHNSPACATWHGAA